MRMKPVLTLVAIATAAPFAQSLPDALRNMEAGNNTLKASQARVETATENHQATYGNFLPVVKLEATAMHMDRDIVMDLDPIREALIQVQTANINALTQLSGPAMQSAYPTLSAAQIAQMLQANKAKSMEQLNSMPHFFDTVKTQNDWGVALTAYQPLFHGGKILAAKQIAKARVNAAESDQERQKSDLRRDFTRLYLQGALLKQSIQLRTQALETIHRHRDRAQKLIEQGLADKATLLRAEMALAEATTSLADDSAKLQSVALTLAQLSGSTTPVLPTDTLTAPPRPSQELDAMESRLAANNPLLKSLSSQQDVAHKAISVKTADFLPEVGLIGKYEFNHEAARSELQPIWLVGIKGTFTLFRGGNDWHTRQAAISTEREVVAMRAEATAGLTAQFQRQKLALRQARTRWENLGAQAMLARENHRVTAARFEQGQATGLEVVDAWLAQQKSELERLSAASDGWMSLEEILWASGNTTEFVNLWTGAKQ
jgi:outer membrane protein TolC